MCVLALYAVLIIFQETDAHLCVCEHVWVGGFVCVRRVSAGAAQLMTHEFLSGELQYHTHTHTGHIHPLTYVAHPFMHVKYTHTQTLSMTTPSSFISNYHDIK